MHYLCVCGQGPQLTRYERQMQSAVGYVINRARSGGDPPTLTIRLSPPDLRTGRENVNRPSRKRPVPTGHTPCFDVRPR